MELTGARILARSLLEQGVDLIFGYPGGTVINIFDALGECSDEIRVVLPAHEQGGAHAADAYARVSGRPGVVIATSGPGATNIVTGIANAYMDSVPLVAITGNVSRQLMGRDSFQEIDICGITMPITKHNYLVQNISALAATVREAFEIAVSGRPGPVLIDIPKDVTAKTCEYVPAGRYEKRAVKPPAENKLAAAAAMLAKSERPLIFCGGGVVSSEASGELRKLAERLGVPVAASLMGLTALPASHPLMLGMIGMHGTPASNYASSHCDLLISAGTRFSDRVAGDRTRFAPKAKIIHIDIDPSEFDKNVICDLHIKGDALDVLAALSERPGGAKYGPWAEEIAAFKAGLPAAAEETGRLRPRELVEMVCRLAGKDAVIVTDVGQHQMWTAQYYGFCEPRSLITSGGLGAMGFGMGAALGAKAAAPERPVVLITGDGSFHMALSELAVSVAERLPVIVLIMNNGVLGMVRQWQSMFYDSRYTATSPGRKTDFAALGEAFGSLGYRPSALSEAETAFSEALKSGRTAVIDCRIDPDEKVFPMIPPGKSGKDILYSE